MFTGTVETTGKLTMKITRGEKVPARKTPWQIRRAIIWWHVVNLFANRWRELPLEAALLFARCLRWAVPGLNIPMHGRLWLKVTKGNGEVWDYGYVGCHLITTAGKNYLAACFNNTNEPENMKYHGFGTGTGAAAVGDTALGTELTTQYATDNVRPTGSQAVASAVYTTVGTLAPDSGGTIAVTEWGLFSATSSTTLFDRQVFSAVNLVANADSLATTYALTIA